MPKAQITLPNGTLVAIEGTPEEVGRLLAMYSGDAIPTPSDKSAKKKRRPSSRPSSSKTTREQGARVDLIEIVNLIRSSKEFEEIEKKILDEANVVNKVLMPMWVIHEHKGNEIGLTSGEISAITKQLGSPVSQPNASRCLSGDGKSFVIGDKMRVKGHAVRYKLHRRGVQHIAQALKEQASE